MRTIKILKQSNPLALTVVTAIIATILAGCEGPQGPQGPQVPQGPQGTSTTTSTTTTVQVECDRTATITKYPNYGGVRTVTEHYALIDLSEAQARHAVVEYCDLYPEPSANTSEWNYCGSIYNSCAGSLVETYCRTEGARHTAGQVKIVCEISQQVNNEEPLVYGFGDIRLTYP